MVRFNRSQGILIELAALEQAEQACTGDAEDRVVVRARAAEQRRHEDRVLAARMADQIRALFPGCPPW